MYTKSIFRASAFALLMALAAGPAAARSADETPPDTLCTVIGTAARYLGTTVTVRGVASSAGKVTLLSDAECKGSVSLTLDDGGTRKRDIASFKRAVASNGAQATATVSGRFRSTDDAKSPYAIDVYSVRDVVNVQ
ncbi:MAG TPA: hypothetical protein VM621_11690 [Luteibacter sp.]|uniref:hypothetical protein n=1 Tax=Luteibacter sp. TaxID=1886636 RepID=UPI002CA8510B|nr:hypothetical protein [Luteibacter sp.]HVI55695.1 hypothetical protein [Luteibacter sp.]